MERCIDDELPFEIPENWRWCRLKSIVNVVSARRVHQSDWRSEGVPFYRAREIGKLADTGSVDNELFITEALYTEFASSGVPHPGDLMVTAVGLSLIHISISPLQRQNIAFISSMRCICSQQVHLMLF